MPSIIDLSPADLAFALAAFGRNRRAVKRFLHERGMNDSAAGVDELITYINARSDVAQIKRLALAADGAATDARASFDPAADLRRSFVDRGVPLADAVARIARDCDLPPDQVRAIVDGQGDPPLSVFMAVFEAAGARRVQFPDRPWNATPDQTTRLTAPR